MKRRPCKRCLVKHRAGVTLPPVSSCAPCINRNPHLYTNETKLEELAAIERRIADGDRDGPARVGPRRYIAKIGIENLTPEQATKFRMLLNRYLARARALGKDVSTHAKRQPYVMIAVRWATATPEAKLEFVRRARSTNAKLRFLHRVMEARVLARQGIYPERGKRQPKVRAKMRTKITI